MKAGSFATGGLSDGGPGARWLARLGLDPAQQVFVSWGPKEAVATDWELFARRWDDFCYPSSDEALVWPPSEDWLLYYFHEEYLIFARRHTMSH